MTADTIMILLMVVASSGKAYFAGYVSALQDEQNRNKKKGLL
jgi:hypothetical protein